MRSIASHRTPFRATPGPGSAAAGAAALLLLLLASAWLVGCAPAEREAQLDDLARWQDRRLAPTDSLAALISGPDAHVRRAALRAAGLIGRTDVLPAMLAALDDRSQTVRAEAAFGLGLVADPAAVVPLSRLLDDPHPAVREAAIAGLSYLDHDGSLLYAVALRGRPDEAAAAWTALRHAAGRADRDSLLAAVRTGLARSESAVRWRVLRCAELVADSTLVAQIAPYAIDRDLEVRVHALRALARHEGPAALAAVLDAADRQDGLRGRDLVRVRVAGLRALGRLAGPVLAETSEEDHGSPAGRAAAILGRGVADPEPAVAVTALLAATNATRPIVPPAEAARLESLLPVWRLRLARAVAGRLDDPLPAVRAAACGALGALRGEGAKEALVARLDDPDPTVGGAALEALVLLDPRHDEVCDWTTELRRQHGPAGDAAVLAALPGLIAELRSDGALQSPVTHFPRRGDPACLPSLAWWLAARGLLSDDFAVRAQAAPVLAELPGDSSRRVALDAWQAEAARGHAEVQLALLRALARLFAAEAAGEPGFVPHRQECLFFAAVGLPAARNAALDSLLVEPATGTEHTEAAAIFSGAFAHHDLRVRLAAREAALATDLLSARLVPPAASLRETLPAHARHREQPVGDPRAETPRVRCVTDHGEFEIRLWPETAPATVAAFVALIERGFHDDLALHRVVEDFVVQGGCPRGDGWGGPGWTLRCEYSRQPFARGTVGMAHAGKDTGGSQWFVCLSAQPHLDGRYTAFGEVVRGLDVLDRLQRGDRYRLEIVAR